MKKFLFFLLLSMSPGWGGWAAAADLDVRPLAGEIEGDSGESSLYRGPDGTLYLTWSGPGDRDGERALRLALLAPGAAKWSEPKTVVSTPLLMENWADFATCLVGTDGTIWAQWYQRPEDGSGYSGWFSRSKDGGVTWASPRPLGHEFVSFAPLGDGKVLAVWLESARRTQADMPRVKRDPSAPRPPKDPHAPYVPSMSLQSCLLDAEGTVLEKWVVDPDVCNCCQTTLALLSENRVLVSYRGHTRDEMRDNHVAHFDGRKWDPPAVLNDDGWKIAACPVNGPAADAKGDHTAVAWFTAAGGGAHVQAKLSSDGGKSFGPPLRLDLGRPIGRIDLVALDDGSFLASWLEARSAENSAGLYVRRIFPDGDLSAPHLVVATSAVRASGFARMVPRTGDELPVVITWTAVEDTTSGSTKALTQVHTATIPAGSLGRMGKAFVAVSRGDKVQLLEVCSVAAMDAH